jgi:release factor glutamine methyltransferase
MSGIYEPSEDTFLLLDAIESFRGKIFRRALEVGSGSGLITVALSKVSSEVVAVDISSEAVRETWRRLKSSPYAGISHTILGDMLSMFREDYIFDLIVCNPPYLPREGLEDKTIEGGFDFVERVISESKTRIISGGILLLLVSTLTGDLDEILLYLRSEGFNPYIKLSRKLFFEEISIIEAVKNS